MRVSQQSFYLFFLIESIHCRSCCECNKKLRKEPKIRNYIQEESENNNKENVNLLKRQLDFEDDLGHEPPQNSVATDGTIEETTVGTTETDILNATTALSTNDDSSTNYTNFTDIQSTTIANDVETEVLKKCPHYKNGAPFNSNVIADVWENTYYQLNQKLACFRIHLKLVTSQEQKYYERIYGNFSNSVQWDKCVLEIKAGPQKTLEAKKHFLQATGSNNGIMDNIIIVEEYNDKVTKLTLRDEHPDQWMLVKDLLLMRDCDDGDIVVFARVPFQPRREDILEALAIFGVDKPNGTLVCARDDDKKNSNSNADDMVYK